MHKTDSDTSSSQGPRLQSALLPRPTLAPELERTGVETLPEYPEHFLLRLAQASRGEGQVTAMTAEALVKCNVALMLAPRSVIGKAAMQNPISWKNACANLRCAILLGCESPSPQWVLRIHPITVT